MSKHTPGPWHYDFASGMKNGSPQVVEYFVRRDSDNVSIAADIVDPEKCVPSEANARLIAAAPDLLEARTTGSEINTPDFMDWIADRLVNVYGENPNIDFVQSLRYRAKLIRAAIAKAKGEV